MVRRKLEEKGLRVSERKLRYAALDGSVVEEDRITGYSEDGSVKVTYQKFSDGRKRLSILIRGRGASREAGEAAEARGGKIDIEEGERLYAVFDGVGERAAEEIIDDVLASRPAQMGSKSGRRS